MDTKLADRLEASLAELRATGLFKHERVLNGPQGGHVVADGATAINLCANNYLGLANHPEVVAAVLEDLPERCVVDGEIVVPSADGSHSLACAVIVKRVDARTRAKTSINDLLRA